MYMYLLSCQTMLYFCSLCVVCSYVQTSRFRWWIWFTTRGRPCLRRRFNGILSSRLIHSAESNRHAAKVATFTAIFSDSSVQPIWSLPTLYANNESIVYLFLYTCTIVLCWRHICPHRPIAIGYLFDCFYSVFDVARFSYFCISSLQSDTNVIRVTLAVNVSW